VAGPRLSRSPPLSLHSTYSTYPGCFPRGPICNRMYPVSDKVGRVSEDGE